MKPIYGCRCGEGKPEALRCPAYGYGGSHPTVGRTAPQARLRHLPHPPHSNPLTNPAETPHEYGLELVTRLKPATYDGIVLAVAHQQFRNSGAEHIRSFGKPGHVLYDLKCEGKPEALRCPAYGYGGSHPTVGRTAPQARLRHLPHPPHSNPLTNPAETPHEYGLELVTRLKPATYDGIVLAVAHQQFRDSGAEHIRSFGKPGHVLYDLKYLFGQSEADLRL